MPLRSLSSRKVNPSPSPQTDFLTAFRFFYRRGQEHRGPPSELYPRGAQPLKPRNPPQARAERRAAARPERHAEDRARDGAGHGLPGARAELRAPAGAVAERHARGADTVFVPGYGLAGRSCRSLYQDMVSLQVARVGHCIRIWSRCKSLLLGSTAA